MKIALYVSHFPLLSETFILNQITGLIQRGHEVDIYSAFGADKLHHPDVLNYALLDRTRHSLKVPANKVARYIKVLGTMCSHGWRRPSLVIRLFNPFNRTYRRFGHVSLWFRAMILSGRDSYDVLHAHFGPNGARLAELRALGLIKGPLVTTFHGVDITSFVKNSPPNVYARLFLLGELMLPISLRWHQRLKELGCHPDKIRVHRMGIDISRFQYYRRNRTVQEPVRLFSVARLTEKKGIEYAVRAVGHLRDRNIAVLYEVAGDGTQRRALEALVDELRLRNQVVFLGPLDSDAVMICLKKSHVFVAPSVTAGNGDQEGIPVAIMEAMATGLPVVSTLHSGIPELVEDGVSGFLVPERDFIALADRLSELVGSSALCSEMGLAGRKRIEEQYDSEKLNLELLTIYQSVQQRSRDSTSRV